MQRWPVESSQIASVGYDSAKQVLEIEFKRGNTVYHYAQVPPEVHEELMAAKSIGKFFNAEIRDKFPFHKLEEAHASDEAQADEESGEEEGIAPRTAHPDSGFSEV